MSEQYQNIGDITEKALDTLISRRDFLELVRGGSKLASAVLEIGVGVGCVAHGFGNKEISGVFEMLYASTILSHGQMNAQRAIGEIKDIFLENTE